MVPNTPLQLFELTTKMFQTPAYVHPQRGTKLKGLFRISANATVVKTMGDLVDAVVLYVLDTSSSMQGERLAELKLAAEASIGALKDGNRVGVITFASSGTTRWLVSPIALDATNRQDILQKIKYLKASGNTCFFEPLTLAYDTLLSSSELIKHIEFLTDGESTDGVYDENQTLLLAGKLPNSGITSNAYGTGTGYDVNFMDAFVDAAKGQFFHVQGSGQGLGHLMGNNAARTAQAVAGSVIVSIDVLNGFTFEADSQPGTFKPVYRTAPGKVGIKPLSATQFVDPIGTVNQVEGIPYEFSLSGPAIQGPVGQITWDLHVATMTIRYKTVNGPQLETIYFIQTFTTDFDSVVKDQSVVDTMNTTAMQVAAADLVRQYSIAQTMGDTAKMAAISMQMTGISTNASKANLLNLSADLGQLASGMDAGDTDSVKAQNTMMQSGDFGSLQSGMEN